MQPYIEQTIALVDQRIASLQSLRDSLLTLDVPTPLSEPEYKSPNGHKPAPQVRRSGRVAEAVREFKPRKGRNNSKVIEACHTLVEPFTVAELARMSGLSYNGAGSQLWRWLQAGLVAKVAAGQYSRTPSFLSTYPRHGSNTPPPTPAATRGKVSVSELETALQAACKHRDHARANGRDQIEAVFQRQIDALEDQIAAAKS